MPVSFPVTANLKPGEPDGFQPLDTIKAIPGAEAFGSNASSLVGVSTKDRYYGSALTTNGFLRATHEAFARHYPLVLSPDDVWLALAQGFSHHVNANSQKLRAMFVKHEGQKYIEVRRDNFVKGSPDNDWSGAFEEFSTKIGEQIGDEKRRMMASRFSTTTPVERAVSELTLMDATKAYFSYGMRTLCGIPEITLLGTVEDWRDIKARAQTFAEYEGTPMGIPIKDWSRAITKALKHFISAFQGNADPEFWQSFYKEGGGSGGPYVSGEINVFFPYLMTKTGPNKPNTTAWSGDHRSPFGGATVGEIPRGLATVPFVWHYHSTSLPMNLVGGFVGVHQDQSGALRPAQGWGIVDRIET